MAAALRPLAARLHACAVLVLALSACQQGGPRTVVFDPPRVVPDFEIGAEAARPFRLSRQRGKVVVVTFGYTSCPDICPTALSRLRALREALGPAAANLETVFVSVDPQRDTRERLETYASAFDARLIPIRMEGLALAELMAGFGVTARRNEVDSRRYASRAKGHGSYSIDHTGGFFVIGPEGRLQSRLPHDVTAAELQRAVGSLLPPRMEVETARAQLTPSGVGAVYLRLVNLGGADDALLSARTPAAAQTELHEVVADGEVLRMVARPDGFEVPRGGIVELAPGGKHLMLFGVVATDALELELTFRHAPAMRVQIPAGGPLAGAAP